MKTYEERVARIEEKADHISRNRRRTKILSVTACFLVLVLTICLVLFVPYQQGGINLSLYKNSEYYEVIEKLSSLTYEEATTTNNFTEWFGDISFGGYGSSSPTDDNDGVTGAASSDGAAMPDYDDGGSSSQTYEEVTNNQTEGVIEGDLFKRSDKYIYYLKYISSYYYYETVYSEEYGKDIEEKVQVPGHYIIDVFNIAGEDTELVAEYEIFSEDNTTYAGYYDDAEMFLTTDCNNLIILTPCYDSSEKILYTSLITLDVSDVENITESNRIYVSGSYISSRMTSESILLVSNFTVKNNTDFSDEAQFLPQTGTLDNLQSLPVENITLPESATTAAYTVICLIDTATLVAEDCVALLSYSDEVYVSSDNAFVTRSYYTTREDNFITGEGYATVTYLVTEIVQVNYSDTLTVENSVIINGNINDRYSMDEYEGVLRVFTTTTYDLIKYTYLTEDHGLSGLSYYQSANLYCIDLADMQFIASVENFCPAGESVMSARFSGKTAYVCTAVIYEEYANDPVYQFDLSDYDNITYTDTGTIPGYSLSLITFTDGTLLGIGYGDWLTTLSITLYRQNGSEVEIVAEYVFEYADFSTEFKAYFIDAENGLIGLGVQYYDENAGRYGEYITEYILLRFDGYNLVEVTAITDLADNYFDRMRADYIDGYLYVFTLNGQYVSYIG